MQSRLARTSFDKNRYVFNDFVIWFPDYNSSGHHLFASFSMSEPDAILLLTPNLLVLGNDPTSVQGQRQRLPRLLYPDLCWLMFPKSSSVSFCLFTLCLIRSGHHHLPLRTLTNFCSLPDASLSFSSLFSLLHLVYF